MLLTAHTEAFHPHARDTTVRPSVWIGQLIEERRQAFKARTGQEMSCVNVWLAGHLQEQDALGRIIVKIEQTRLADGTVQAIRGAGVAARTDAIPLI
ncbi:hypothetical protein ETD83_02715 [Actinomadura soli]|uniref:Uncharacterized protein n=1 Tax=Actinomadura soli TaxID=2508997 RepID=A0A5C4JK44_9ACTN|nr:hypothetical protein [Actinomadura soli]TMR06943.1 hypothetical protein ETD83_02715 [Actinomadura soli]